MTYVCKLDADGNVRAIQKTDATPAVIDDLIKKSKDHWIILEDDKLKRMAQFYLEEKNMLTRRYNLDDVVDRLNQVENELYAFRRFAQEESKRIKEGLE